MKNAIMSVLVVSLCAGVVASPGEKGSSGDMRLLQGKWRVWFAENVSIVIEVTNDTFTMSRHSPAGVGEPAKGSFTIDEKPTPKHMTWKNVRGGGLNLEINRCIYELHGDTWLLIGGVNDRPEHFYSGAGKPHQAWILKRVK